MEFLGIFGFFAICFAGSCALAYLITYRRKGSNVQLAPGTVFHLRMLDGVYRSMLMSPHPKGWWVSAPLRRDHHVAIRPGESMIVEAADERGAYLFRSTVLERDAECHQLLLARPRFLSRIERREVFRSRARGAVAAWIDGNDAQLLDISEQGARLATRAEVGRGERIRLDIDGREGPVFAWVLDTMPGSQLGYDSAEVRVRFEEALSGRA